MIYGKLVNGKLIKLDNLIVQNGKILISSNNIANNVGYKPIKYVVPPNFREGFDLISTWQEDNECIYQVWNYVSLNTDYSSELLVAIRNLNYSINSIFKTIENMMNSNKITLNKILNDNILIKEVYLTLSKLHPELTPLKYFNNNIHSVRQLFNELNLSDFLSENGYYFSDENLLLNRHVNSKLITYPYIKNNLFNLDTLRSFSTLENKTYLSMSYLYIYTLFDEFLLKVIRYITSIDNFNLMEKDKISYEEIINCNTKDEIIGKIITANVEKLAWGSYKDKLDYFERHGIIFSLDTQIYKDAIIYIAEKRNALIHNEGIFNSGNWEKIKNTCYKNEIRIGEQISLTKDLLDTDAQILMKVSEDLYNTIYNKYNLTNKWKNDKVTL